MGNNQFIKQVTVKNFKSIVEMTLLLKNVNIFIGPNGSGKSNILEAIGVLSAATTGRVEDTSLQWRGVRPGVSNLYKSAFQEHKIAPHIYFEATSEKAKYTVSLHNPLKKQQIIWRYKTEELFELEKSLFSRGAAGVTGHDVKKLNSEQGLAALKMVELTKSRTALDLLNCLRDFAIYSPNTLTLRGLSPDAQNRSPVGLSGGSIAEAVQQLLNYVSSDDDLEENFSDFISLIDWTNKLDTSSLVDSLLSPTIPRQKLSVLFHDKYMRKDRNVLTAYDASEGALYILFAAVLLLLPNSPKFFAIDNLDQALNPRLVRNLTASICRCASDPFINKQILFTAHNPAVLDGIPLRDSNVQLFIVDRNAAGFTQCCPLNVSDDLIRLSKEKNWPLSQLWMTGHLGGVPNV